MQLHSQSSVLSMFGVELLDRVKLVCAGRNHVIVKKILFPTPQTRNVF